jgi:predicted RNA-binding Zn-ribbon protein involved in translation (DUF1610 family)
MDEADTRVLCPACHRIVPVDPEWRLVQCPGCGAMITRMSVDSAYD